MNTPLSSMLLVLVASLFGSFGAVFLKSGAQKLRHGLRYLVLNLRLAAGVALFLASSAFYVVGLKRGEVSVLYPMVSLANVWTLAWSRIFFKEPITRAKTMGLLLIMVGVFFIGLGAETR
ncbi:MAG TPA: EamA family transporter [Bryobacteraceae bacterium]|nr:EamA family transporter [Bryobacteraceae bacterium]